MTIPAHYLAAFATSALAAGCSESPNTSDAAMPGMPAMQQAALSAAEHMAEGTLNAVDTASGTVKISHGPVASASWPAMTMSFKLADSVAIASLKPGQHVKFQFTIQNGTSATVTRISPSD
jgi:Cu/Ag efflux protein CusF